MTPYLQQRTLFPPLITRRVSQFLELVVVIPAYKEDYLLLTLMDLQQCQLPPCKTEVIIVLNNSEKCQEQVYTKHQQQIIELHSWAKKNNSPGLRFYPIWMDELPAKHAGVGLARKIGMDEACLRLTKAGHNKDGIIAALDADSRIAPNYLTALYNHFKQYSKTSACSIHFEHPLSGATFSAAVYDAIKQYELHLRYYINAQRLLGLPYAYYTVGSSMAVRCVDYQKQGGMNRRKAGEDFYFLQKFIQLGNFSELKTTTVIPSPRPSERVPFGTGRAVNQLIQEQGDYLSYAPESFLDLQKMIQSIEALYVLGPNAVPKWFAQMPTSIQHFLNHVAYQEKIRECFLHTASKPAFIDRFFKWFNAFQLMKCLHFLRDHYYPDIPVVQAGNFLLEQLGVNSGKLEVTEQLLLFRRFDQEQHYQTQPF